MQRAGGSGSLSGQPHPRDNADPSEGAGGVDGEAAGRRGRQRLADGEPSAPAVAAAAAAGGGLAGRPLDLHVRALQSVLAFLDWRSLARALRVSREWQAAVCPPEGSSSSWSANLDLRDEHFSS